MFFNHAKSRQKTQGTVLHHRKINFSCVLATVCKQSFWDTTSTIGMTIKLLTHRSNLRKEDELLPLDGPTWRSKWSQSKIQLKKQGIESRIKYSSHLHCTGAPNMPPSVRAEGLKSKETAEDGSRHKWEVRPSGKTLSTSSPWGRETLSWPVGNTAQGWTGQRKYQARRTTGGLQGAEGTLSIKYQDTHCWYYQVLGCTGKSREVAVPGLI